MSTPTGAVNAGNPLSGVKRALNGRPTGLPGSQPSFRGNRVAPENTPKAPKLANGNRQNAGTNVTIPYAFVCPLEMLDQWCGRLAPGDVCFSSRYPISFMGSNSGANAKRAAYGGPTQTVGRIIGLDGMNKLQHGATAPRGWVLGENVFECDPGHAFKVVRTESFGGDTETAQLRSGASLNDFYVPTKATNKSAKSIEESHARTGTFRISVLNEHQLQGVVLSNDEPGVTTSSGKRDATIFNVCIAGKAMVNNGFCHYDGENIDQDGNVVLSPENQPVPGSNPIVGARTVETQPRGSLEVERHMSRPLYTMGTTTDSSGNVNTHGAGWLPQGSYDWVSAFTGGYSQYPVQCFDRQIAPSSDVYIGLVAIKLSETQLKLLTNDKGGTYNTDANLEYYYYQWLPFSSRKAYLLEEVTQLRAKRDFYAAAIIDAGVAADAQALAAAKARLKATEAALRAIKVVDSNGDRRSGTRNYGLDQDPFDAVRLNDMKLMVGAWRVGRVTDVAAARYSAYAGGPADTGFALTVQVKLMWHPLCPVPNRGGAEYKSPIEGTRDAKFYADIRRLRSTFYRGELQYLDQDGKYPQVEDPSKPGTKMDNPIAKGMHKQYMDVLMGVSDAVGNSMSPSLRTVFGPLVVGSEYLPPTSNDCGYEYSTPKDLFDEIERETDGAVVYQKLSAPEATVTEKVIDFVKELKMATQVREDALSPESTVSQTVLLLRQAVQKKIAEHDAKFAPANKAFADVEAAVTTLRRLEKAYLSALQKSNAPTAQIEVDDDPAVNANKQEFEVAELKAALDLVNENGNFASLLSELDAKLIAYAGWSTTGAEGDVEQTALKELQQLDPEWTEADARAENASLPEAERAEARAERERLTNEIKKVMVPLKTRHEKLSNLSTPSQYRKYFGSAPFTSTSDPDTASVANQTVGDAEESYKEARQQLAVYKTQMLAGKAEEEREHAGDSYGKALFHLKGVNDPNFDLAQALLSVQAAEGAAVAANNALDEAKRIQQEVDDEAYNMQQLLQDAIDDAVTTAGDAYTSAQFSAANARAEYEQALAQYGAPAAAPLVFGGLTFGEEDLSKLRVVEIKSILGQVGGAQTPLAGDTIADYQKKARAQFEVADGALTAINAVVDLLVDKRDGEQDRQAALSKYLQYINDLFGNAFGDGALYEKAVELVAKKTKRTPESIKKQFESGDNIPAEFGEFQQSFTNMRLSQNTYYVFGDRDPDTDEVVTDGLEQKADKLLTDQAAVLVEVYNDAQAALASTVGEAEAKFAVSNSGAIADMKSSLVAVSKDTMFLKLQESLEVASMLTEATRTQQNDFGTFAAETVKTEEAYSKTVASVDALNAGLKEQYESAVYEFYIVGPDPVSVNTSDAGIFALLAAVVAKVTFPPPSPTPEQGGGQKSSVDGSRTWSFLDQRVPSSAPRALLASAASTAAATSTTTPSSRPVLAPSAAAATASAPAAPAAPRTPAPPSGMLATMAARAASASGSTSGSASASASASAAPATNKRAAEAAPAAAPEPPAKTSSRAGSSASAETAKNAKDPKSFSKPKRGGK